MTDQKDEQIERLKEELEKSFREHKETLDEGVEYAVRAAQAECDRDTLRAEVTKWKREYALQNEDLKEALIQVRRLSDEEDEYVTPLKAEVARLTAERDEARESVLKWTGEAAEYARQLAELRKDGERKANLLGRCYHWVGNRAVGASPQVEVLMKLKEELKPYWQAIDAARKEQV